MRERLPWAEGAEMIVHPAHWRRVPLAAIRFCVTLAALALAAAGATAATAGTTTAFHWLIVGLRKAEPAE